MLLYGLGLNPAMMQNVNPQVRQQGEEAGFQVSRDPGQVMLKLTAYDECLKAHLQARCGGARTIVEAKARCDANTPVPTCGGGGDGGGDGEGGGDGGAEQGFFAKHKTKLVIGGGLIAAYLVLRR
jgi:hypothetical protein